MKRPLIVLSIFIVLSFFLPNESTFADDPTPSAPTPPPLFQLTMETGLTPPGIPQLDPDGFWYMNQSFSTAYSQSITALTTGGPDEFGYTWDDSVPFTWIDATSGTDTGMSGWGPAVNVVLPFTFKFYENEYDSLWIVPSGYISFSGEGLWRSQGDSGGFPAPSLPNNVIAAYWTSIQLAINGPSNRVYYSSGGESPNRYFVVEWYEVVDTDETYTFEIILHENGDLVFQYDTMTYIEGYTCASAGIEDSTGEDGLNYIPFCGIIRLPQIIVRFNRPDPAARVKVTPSVQGSFSSPNEMSSFELNIKNIGELGSDTFDLTEVSSWSVSFFEQDGVTPLTDTDSDGIIDSGEVAQDASVTFVAKIQPPSSAGVGDRELTTITATSSLDTNKHDSATLQGAIPARFAQIYSDVANGAMSIYLVDPNVRNDRKVTADEIYGSDMIIAETPGFVYAWSNGRCLDDLCSIWVTEIEYTLLDNVGNTVRAVTKLVDLSGVSMITQDYPVAVAVAPDGYIGMLWSRTLYNADASQFNVNIYFAILDASGDITYGPLNLTNNDVWGTYGDLNVPLFYSLRIEATGDSRFVLAWDKSHVEILGSMQDIYYAVRASDGTMVKEVTNLTLGTPSDTRHRSPVLAPLSENRVFLSWNSMLSSNSPQSYYWDVYYIVMDSAGNLIKSPTNLSEDENLFEFGNYDAIELVDGSILAVWQAYGCFPDEFAPRIRYATLDNSYNRVGTPNCLEGGASTGDLNASVTTDEYGHGILTWQGAEDSRLYYALINKSGTVLTEPTIFKTAGLSPWGRYIRTGGAGYGNTTFSMEKVYLPLIMKD